MTEVRKPTDNLFINVLSKEQFAQEQELDKEELYVVTQNAQDAEGNAVSSKTYADVGRDAVVTQSQTPTSEYTQIWINPSEEVVYITPASTDLDNLTATGVENLQSYIAPDYSRGVSQSGSQDASFTTSSTGWIYAILGVSSRINLKKDSSVGIDLLDCETDASTKTSSHILVEKGTVVYINSRSGTVNLVFYPCKGLSA